MSVLSQKDYLKKYLGIGKGSVEKKKKKTKKILNGLRIVDDDIDVSLSEEIQVDLTADNEEAPQIVSVIDERPPSLRIDEVTRDYLWKPIGVSDISFNSEKSSQIDFNKSTLKSSHKSIDRRERSELSKVSQRPEHSSAQNSRNIDDFSLLRRDKNRGDRLKLPKSSDKLESYHTQNARHTDDFSPPRKSIRSDNSDFDNSPPRKAKNRDEKLEPCKSSGKPRGFPSQNSRNIDDLSPHRKSKRSNTSDLNTSPPRRDKRLKLPKSTDRPGSTPVQNFKDIDDFSPPRKNKRDDSLDLDNSPPRRDKNDDLFPRGKGSIKELCRGLSSKTMDNSGNDASYTRKGSAKRSRWGDSDDKMKKTLDGKKAGLQNATDLISEMQKLKEREDEIFKSMSTKLSGANAATIVRGKKEINWEEEESRRKKAEENKDKYDKWGRGLKQVDDINEKMKNELYEMSKPLARYADDEDLEKYLKDQEREGDPMLAYIRKKKKKKAVQEGKPTIKQYEGDAPPNRFGIRPGYRWDGVNRSNGYEKQWFEVQNSCKANIEESYKWSTEDM